MTGTVHVPVNGKRNVAIDFAVIEARLRAKARGLDVCARCEEPSVEVLRFWHPYIPALGLCRAHLEQWAREQLLG